MNKIRLIKNLLIWFIFIYLIIKFTPSYTFYINAAISFIVWCFKFIAIIMLSAFGTSLFNSFIDESIRFFQKEYPTQVQNYYSTKFRLADIFKNNRFLRNFTMFINYVYLYRIRILFKFFRHLYKNKLAYITSMIILIPLTFVVIMIT